MMKIRSFAAALALAAAPGLLAAQQTQPAQGHARHGGWQQGQRGEHRGGIQRLIARRDQLRLNASQVSRLQAIQQRLESQDRPLQDRMRALFQQAGLPDFRARRAERGAQGQRAERRQLTEQQRQALRRVREQAKPIREQMRQNRQAALRDVQAVLTPAQKQQVQQQRQQRQERRSERRHGGHRGHRGEGRQGAARPQG